MNRLLQSLRIPSMRTRCTQKELMDDAGCDSKALLRTVRHFALINRLFSRSLCLARRYFFTAADKAQSQPLTVLDVGAGGGDFARSLSSWAQRHGIALHITCIERDPRIAGYARRACAGSPDIDIVESDITEPSFAAHRFNFVFANHFLHHIPDRDLARTIALCNTMAVDGLLLNDLERNGWAYLGYSLFAAVFFPRSFAWYDGRLSIRRGFTTDELRAHINDAGRGSVLAVGTAFPGRVFVYRRAKTQNMS